MEVMTFHEGHRFEHEREIFLPDGGIDLIIDLGPRKKKLYRDERSTVGTEFQKGWISGMRSGRSIITSGDGSPMVVVRFKPGRARRFAGVPMSELNDRVIPLSDLWGPAFHTVRDRIGEHWQQHGVKGILGAAEHALEPIAGPANGNDRRVELALGAINNAAGSARVGVISTHLGCSQKHLIDLFHREVGLAPKAFSDIVRFQSVIQRLETEPDPDWLDLAVQHGYYDQSHLVNAFQEAAGMSPEKYMRMKGPFLNWIPVV